MKGRKKSMKKKENLKVVHQLSSTKNVRLVQCQFFKNLFSNFSKIFKAKARSYEEKFVIKRLLGSQPIKHLNQEVVVTNRAVSKCKLFLRLDLFSRTEMYFKFSYVSLS